MASVCLYTNHSLPSLINTQTPKPTFSQTLSLLSKSSQFCGLKLSDSSQLPLPSHVYGRTVIVAKGDRIQASIPRNLVQKYKAELEEGRIYGLKNFKVVYDTRVYRATSSKYRILISDKTRILKLLLEDFPDRQFCFKSFDDIQRIDNINEISPFDVIGSVAHVGTVQHHTTPNGADKRLITITLEDTENRALSCTLWEEYVDKFFDLMENQLTTPNILIVQFCKISRFGGERRVSNVFYATKLLLNAEVLISE